MVGDDIQTEGVGNLGVLDRKCLKNGRRGFRVVGKLTEESFTAIRVVGDDTKLARSGIH